jgi:hypothetical protein
MRDCQRQDAITYLSHFICRLRMRTPREVFIDLLSCDCLQYADELGTECILGLVFILPGCVADGGWHVDLAHGRDERDDLDAIHRFEKFLGDCSSSDAP